MSPMGWVFSFFGVLMIIFMPIWIIDSLASDLPDTYRKIVILIGTYILMPALVSYLYAKKFVTHNKGSIIFWMYCGFYSFFFLIFLSYLFSKELTFETIIAPIITGTVAFFMILFAYKTRLKHKKNLQNNYEANREEDIKRQAEAMVLAEKMKKGSEAK